MEQKKRTKLNVFERIILGLTAIPVCIIASATALVVGVSGLVVSRSSGSLLCLLRG